MILQALSQMITERHGTRINCSLTLPRVLPSTCQASVVVRIYVFVLSNLVSGSYDTTLLSLKMMETGQIHSD